MIEIPFGPHMFTLGSVVITWHGFFTFVAVLVAVSMVARSAPRVGLTTTMVYDTAIWAILGGIVGARLVHVIDRWDIYTHNPLQILFIYQGGIAVIGAVLGGLLAGIIYTRLAHYPTAKLADLAAPAVVIAMAIGRIGDIINGEHCALVTDAIWGFVYTHPLSPAAACYSGIPTPPMHPAVVYEMIWDLSVAAILVWILRDRLRPDGMLFTSFLFLYSIGRFFITFLREDKIWFAGLQEAQVLTLLILAATVPYLAYRAQWAKPELPLPVEATRGSRRLRAKKQA